MGAIANEAPELYAGIIADVPFVDVLNTMLDATLPLTPPEWLEWGDPARATPQAFAAIRAYSPYDNVRPQRYPAILALAGLTDPRVTYWEPAKWVARLRATMTGGGPILLRTAMGAGHAGAPGRFDRLEEVARAYAFAIAVANGQIGPPHDRSASPDHEGRKFAGSANSFPAAAGFPERRRRHSWIRAFGCSSVSGSTSPGDRVIDHEHDDRA